MTVLQHGASTRTRHTVRRAIATALVAVIALTSLAACATNDAATPEPTPPAGNDEVTLTVYSGRNENLVGELFTRFTEKTGINVAVRYGNTAELAALIAEEGANTPADLFYAQDAGALGALELAGRLIALPADLITNVDARFRSRTDAWVGVNGRARVIAYNHTLIDEADVPNSVLQLTDPKWKGKLAWSSQNASFQAFVTALRITEGDDVARAWLEGMIANDVIDFENNSGLLDGIARGEAVLGLTNHYYLYRTLAEDPAYPVSNKYLPNDIGGLVNIAGVGVLRSSTKQAAALELARFLLSEEIQTWFANETDAPEYPLRDTVAPASRLPSLAEINPPNVDLTRIADLEGTLEMLRSVGALG
jgi:iron(III) transport system substrate-binding protein